jgi:hypothetical protein
VLATLPIIILKSEHPLMYTAIKCFLAINIDLRPENLKDKTELHNAIIEALLPSDDQKQS